MVELPEQIFKEPPWETVISNGAAGIGNELNIISVSQVPEPSTYIMMLIGLISLGFMRKKTNVNCFCA